MAVRIRLMRMGKIRMPQYRIVIADSRKKRDGRAIEEIGLYHPKEDPSRIEVNSERAQHWLSVGAQPSEPVRRLLELTGDWQKFKGLPAPEALKVAAPKTDKRVVYEAEAKAVAASSEADSEKAKGDKKKPAKKATKAAKADKVAKSEKADKPDKGAVKSAEAAKKPDAEAAKKPDTKAEGKTESEESAGAEAGSES